MKLGLIGNNQWNNKFLIKALREQHYVVEEPIDGQVEKLVRVFDCDLLLLDVVRLGLDSISLIRQLRDQGYNRPILLLGKPDSIQELIGGIDAGADDYMVDPYNLQLLLAHLKALLRRGSFSLYPVCSYPT